MSLKTYWSLLPALASSFTIGRLECFWRLNRQPRSSERSLPSEHLTESERRSASLLSLSFAGCNGSRAVKPLLPLTTPAKSVTSFGPRCAHTAAKFPFLKFSDAEHTVTSREGGRIRAFTTDDPGRAEGFHADADCPLLIIVDEAKSVDPEVIKAIDRCSYNVLLYISSPGLKQGPFYDAFTANRESFITFAVGLTDCPHIAKEKIEDIIST